MNKPDLSISPFNGKYIIVDKANFKVYMAEPGYSGTLKEIKGCWNKKEEKAYHGYFQCGDEAYQRPEEMYDD